MTHRVGGLLQIGQPADFFASERSQQFVRSIGLLGVLALSCAPFLAWQHPSLMSTWQDEFFAALAGIVIGAPLLASRAWRQLDLPASLAPVLLMAGIAAAQAWTGTSATPGVAWMYVVEMAWAAIIMLSVRTLDLVLLRRCASAGLLLAGIVGGALGIVQAMRLPVFQGHPALFAQDGLAYGFIAQRNLFGDVQAMALISLAFWQPPRSKSGVFAQSAAVAILAISAASSGSNALVLYAVMALVWGAVLLRRMPGQGRRLLRMILAASVVGGLTFALRAQVQHVAHVAGAPVLRTLWATALRTILQHPVWGVGLGNTPSVFYDFATTLPPTHAWTAFHTEGWNNVHNLVLQLWMEAGLAGLAVSVMLAGLVVRLFWRARDTEQAWAAALLGVLALHSMVEFPLWTLPFLGLASALLSMTSAHRVWRMPSALGVLPIAAGGILASLAVLAAQMTAQFGLLMQIWGYPFDAKNIGANIQVFAALDRQENRSGVSASVLRPLTTLVQARFPATAIPASQWHQTSERMQALQRIMPSGYVPYVSAEFLALDGQEQAAGRAIRQALRATPGFAPAALAAMQPMTAMFPQIHVVTDALKTEVRHAP